MNDSPEVTATGATSVPPDAAPSTGPAGAPGAPRAATGALRASVPAWAAALLALLLAAAAILYVQGRVARVERDLARRLQASELRDQQAEQQAKLLGDTLRDSQARVAVLEAKLSDLLGQQSQLRQLYDEMARNRGVTVLADAENSVMIAAQQLQLGGNVQSALLAMQDAEQALARGNQPALIGLRRVVARDIERLKAVPLADFAAAVARLDAVIGLVDQMPMLADAAAPSPAPAAARAAARDGLLGLPQRMAQTGLQGWDAFVAELAQLFRVQRVDQPEVLLLSPDQRYVAREGLRLQLLNARLNLLARNEALFRADLARAMRAVERGFDGQNRSVTTALAALRQLHATSLAIELPSLGESIAALRAARAASDAR